MADNYLLTKVGWLTNVKTVYIPQKSLEEIRLLEQQNIEYYHKMYETEINFLQTKKLTTRTILHKGDLISDESSLYVQDLTEDGLRFYITGIREWIKKLDRSKNRKDIVSDTLFLEKKYKEFVKFENPFFKMLISDINDDKKVLESKKKLIPFIEKNISELEGELKNFFEKRSKKTTIDIMSALCYSYAQFYLK